MQGGGGAGGAGGQDLLLSRDSKMSPKKGL